MKFKVEKCSVMSCRHRNVEHDYMLYGQSIRKMDSEKKFRIVSKDSEKNLGIVSKDIKFRNHISSVTKKSQK